MWKLRALSLIKEKNILNIQKKELLADPENWDTIDITPDSLVYQFIEQGLEKKPTKIKHLSFKDADHDLQIPDFEGLVEKDLVSIGGTIYRFVRRELVDEVGDNPITYELVNPLDGSKVIYETISSDRLTKPDIIKRTIINADGSKTSQSITTDHLTDEGSFKMEDLQVIDEE